jgi:hypothetical protein
MSRIVRLVLFVLAACAIQCSTARAETIGITGGFVDFDTFGVSGTGTVQVSGDLGFSYETHGGFIFDGTGAFEPLFPGTTAKMHVAGDNLGGILQFEGVTYSDIGGLNSPANVLLQVDAMVPLPAVVSAHAVVTAPFALNIDFFWMAPDGSASITQSFSGRGAATVDLAENNTSFGVPTWQITALHGELSSVPTPEPSTLLLIGSAGALAIYRRRRVPVPAR